MLHVLVEVYLRGYIFLLCYYLLLLMTWEICFAGPYGLIDVFRETGLKNVCACANLEGLC